jgi:hypothetical protein
MLLQLAVDEINVLKLKSLWIIFGKIIFLYYEDQRSLLLIYLGAKRKMSF